MHANLERMMPQVLGVWCEEEGHVDGGEDRHPLEIEDDDWVREECQRGLSRSP